MKAPSELSRHHFTAEQFDRMVETGVLTKYDRVELIEGEVIKLAPIGPRHAETVRRLTEILSSQLGNTVRLSVQSPIHLTDLSAPEPDIAVLKPGSYSSAHPGPKDSYLIIEVCDTSLVYDKAVKLPAYAEANMAEVWIVDLLQNRIEAHRRPFGGRYSEVQTVGPGESVTSSELPELKLSADTIFAD